MRNTSLKDTPIIQETGNSLSQSHHLMMDSLTLRFRIEMRSGNSKSIQFTSRDTMNSILSSLETVRPETGKNYVYGPLVFTHSNPAGIDAAQKQISKNLGIQLRDNLRAKYSGYG